MKTKRWVNPNKMLFESKHKTFNKQTNLISTGSYKSHTVLSEAQNFVCNN